MIQIIILGIIQGITEFLPVSSSAHLIIAQDLFGIGTNLVDNIGLVFDLALHFGTLLAIIIFFFKDLWKLLINGLTKGTKNADGKLFWHLILATIPAGIIGVLFESIFENYFREKLSIIACALILMGILIYIIDKSSDSNKKIKEMTWKDALIIGCAQVFALVPGFSRSGTTITAGRALNLNREDAAKFSFYLCVPVIGGASFLTLIKDNTMSIISSNFDVFALGVSISFIVGILAISFLLKYIRKHDFKIFMWYRLALGLLVLLLISINA